MFWWRSRESTVLTLDTTISIAKAMETVGRDVKTVAGNSDGDVIKVDQASGDVYVVRKHGQRQVQHRATSSKTNFRTLLVCIAMHVVLNQGKCPMVCDVWYVVRSVEGVS